MSTRPLSNGPPALSFFPARPSPPITAPSRLSVLVHPRDVLPVLEYIHANPSQPPEKAIKDHAMGNNTWYEVTHQLERLGLIASTRGPAKRKVKRFHVTPEGERVLAEMSQVWELVANSPAGLAWELAVQPPPAGAPRAGEILCRLIEHAERHGEFGELQRLRQLSGALQRPGEGHLAAQVSAFLQGQMETARAEGVRAAEALRREGPSRSLRKSMLLQAATLEYLGLPKKAIGAFIETRRAARRAGDAAMEADAWGGIGILHARLEHFQDAFKEMDKALLIAEKAGLDSKRAKILSNLAFAQGLQDERKGLETADEALKVARKVGATIVVARTQLTRSLLLAVVRRRDEARRALREAEKLFAEGGEEKGAALVDEWVRLVKQMLRRHRAPYPEDWRGQALRLARTRPSPATEAPQESPSGLSR